MIADNVQDFRHVIEEKLRAKKSALDQTEQHLRKFSVLRANNAGGRTGSVRGRLGPPTGQRTPMESRLGPKVNNSSNLQHADDDAFENQDKRSVVGRVIMEQQKSRDEALAEEGQKMDNKEKQRNRRMFGNLLGTLQKFKQDENRVKEREMKKREIEKKIDEKTEKEKEEANRTKNELFSEKRKQQNEIRILQAQMNRVQEFELWEKNKRREMQYIRTSVTASDQPQIYYMPKAHNDSTLAKYEASLAIIEEEIKLGKAAFEEDLLKIESKLNNRDFGEDEVDEEEDEEEELKPKSVIVKQPHKRIRDENGKTRESEVESIKVTISNEKVKSKAEEEEEEKPPAKRHRRGSSSNSSSGTSDSDSSSESDGEDDIQKLEKLKRKIKQEIKKEK